MVSTSASSGPREILADGVWTVRSSRSFTLTIEHRVYTPPRVKRASSRRRQPGHPGNSRNGLHKTELIKPGMPWRSIEDVESGTARWADWFKDRLYEAPDSSGRFRWSLRTCPVRFIMSPH